MVKAKSRLRKKELPLEVNIASDAGKCRKSRRARIEGRNDQEDPKTELPNTLSDNKSDNHIEKSAVKPLPGSRQSAGRDESMTTAAPAAMAVMRTRRKIQPPKRFRDPSEPSSDVNSPEKIIQSKQIPTKTKSKKPVTRLETGQTSPDYHKHASPDLSVESNVDDKFEAGSMIPPEDPAEGAAMSKKNPRLKKTQTVIEAGSAIPPEGPSDTTAVASKKNPRMKKTQTVIEAGSCISPEDTSDTTAVASKKDPQLKKTQTVIEAASTIPPEGPSDTTAMSKKNPQLKKTQTVIEAGSAIPPEDTSDTTAVASKKDPRLKKTQTVIEAGSAIPPEDTSDTTAVASKKDPQLKKTQSASRKTCYCSYCGKACRNLAHVTQHERTHSGERPFPCLDCGKRFSLKGNLLQHQRLHSEGKPFACEICGQFFKTEVYCKQHLETHQTSKIHKCEFVGCSKSFNCRKNYRYHKMTHAHRRFECRQCGKAFHRKSQLIIHETGHSKVRNFECPKCGKKSHSINAYNSHMRIHKKKPYSCGKCKKSFETVELRDRHDELHKWYPFYNCELCNRCGMSFPELSRHLKLHRSETLQCMNCSDCGRTFASQNTYDQHHASFEIRCALCNEALATACKWYLHRRTHKTDTTTHSATDISHVCDVCGKSFSTASIYKSHRLTHGDYNYSCEVCGKKSKSKTVHLVHMQIHSGEKTCFCEVCGKSFACRYNLKQHSLIHSGLKPHKCDVCSKSFRTKSLLKEHNLVHRNVNPYKCDLCGKEYASRTNFKNHKNVHENRRDYECEVCGKRFFSGYVLRKHVQIHTGQKNFQCDYCGKEFIQHGNWLIHRRSHTGVKPHRCSRCPQAFVNSSQLKQHVKRVHDKNKTAMCDKCFKHFYDQKSLLKHIQNMHVRKEGTRVYACSKCGAFFTEAANQGIHEMNCTETNSSTTRPSILQNTLKLIYHDQSNENRQNTELHANFKSEMIAKASTSEKYKSSVDLESMDREKHNNCDNLITLFKAITESESKPSLDLEELQIVSLPETRPSNSADDEDVLEQFCVPDAQIKVEVVMEEDIAYVTDTDADDEWAGPGEAAGGISGGVQCSLCKMFLTDHDHQQHLQRHEEECLFQCGRCQSRFRTADSLTKHLQECLVQTDQLSISVTSVPQGRSSIHKCDICQKTFHLLGHLKLHKDSHRDWARLKCNICRREFKNRKAFDDHYRSHGKKRFHCSVCSREFSLRNVLRLHRRNCHQETRYTCPRCSQCFTKIEHLKDHAEAHFRASLATSAGHRSPVPHLVHRSPVPHLVHKSVQASITVLKRGIGKSRTASKTGSKAVPVDIKESDLNEGASHQLGAAVKSASTPTEAVRASFSILYTCGICESRFSTQSDRDRHQDLHRVDVLIYVCSICEQRFTSQDDLEVHQVIHGADVQFLCQICDQRFTSQDDLEVHQVIHGADVQFLCQICDQRFTSQDDLEVHQVIHGADVQFLCQICNLRFKDEALFMDHVSVHGEVVMMVESDPGQAGGGDAQK